MTTTPATAQVGGIDRADRPAEATAAIPLPDDARPGFEPIGGRFGSFFLYPTLDVTGEVTDNVFGTPERRGDAVLAVRAGARIVSGWSRHRLEVDGYGLVNRYADHADQDSAGGGAHVAGEYDGGRAWRGTVDLRLDRVPEDRLDVGAASGSATPVEVRTLAASARLDRTLGDLTLSGRVQQLSSRYADGLGSGGAVVPQGYRDADRSIYTGVARYDLSGGASLILATAYDTLSYARVTTLDRDSRGIRVEGGVGIEVSRVVTGEVRLGYLRRANASPLLRDPAGLSFHAGVRWTPAPRVGLRLDADRDVEDAPSPVAAGNLRSEGRVGLDYELLGNLTLSPSLRVARIDPIGIDGANTEVEEGARALYALSRRYHLIARWRHVDRSAGRYLPLHATQGFLTFGVTL